MLKVFAYDKYNWKIEFVLGRVENNVGEKEKMLVISIFSLSHNVSQSVLLQGKLKFCHGCVGKC